MRFLNLMYTNEQVVNLLAWGIEGEHYVLREGWERIIARRRDHRYSRILQSIKHIWKYIVEIFYIFQGNERSLRTLFQTGNSPEEFVLWFPI